MSSSGLAYLVAQQHLFGSGGREEAGLRTTATNAACKFVIVYEYSATLLSYLWHFSQAGKCIHVAVLLT